MKNLKEFLELKKRYETITLEEIKEAGCNRALLTGFGFPHLCTLCIAVNKQCCHCVYKFNPGCLNGKNYRTYMRIFSANTPIKLLNAYRARAKRMDEVLKELNISPKLLK